MLTKTLRNILLLLLSLGLLLNLLNQSLIYYSFLIQRDYIVKNLCVERFKEENTCQGCCQLEKKMKKADPEKNRDLPFPQSNVKEITTIPFEIIQKSVGRPETVSEAITHYKFDYQFLFYTFIFHPPKHLCHFSYFSS